MPSLTPEFKQRTTAILQLNVDSNNSLYLTAKQHGKQKDVTLCTGFEAIQFILPGFDSSYP
jgi:hypothetical protein